MGKAKARRAGLLDDTEAKAVACNMLRISPQKLNLVAQLIRGKKVAAALADLNFSPQAHRRPRSRRPWRSAIANAENNHDLDVDALVVAEALCRQGDRCMKRLHAARPWSCRSHPTSRSRTSRSSFARARPKA